MKPNLSLEKEPLAMCNSFSFSNSLFLVSFTHHNWSTSFFYQVLYFLIYLFLFLLFYFSHSFFLRLILLCACSVWSLVNTSQPPLNPKVFSAIHSFILVSFNHHNWSISLCLMLVLLCSCSVWSLVNSSQTHLPQKKWGGERFSVASFESKRIMNNFRGEYPSKDQEPDISQ